VADVSGKPRYWTLDRYGEEGSREENWMTTGVRKHHRMVATLLSGVIDAGLALERVIEPMPDSEMLAREPDWIYERKRPFCLLVRARKH
jgi:hypothetical protein